MTKGRLRKGDTWSGMRKAISVRLDKEASKARRALEAAGMSTPKPYDPPSPDRSRRRRHSELVAEVAALEADESDRTEMLAVSELMESLSAQVKSSGFKLRAARDVDRPLPRR